MEELTRIWRQAVKADNNLGQGEVGPSPQHVTMTPALRVLDAMEIDSESVFVDLGSGHGLVTMAAVLHSGARLAYGIELRETPHRFAIEKAALLFGHDPDRWPVRFLHEDFLNVHVAFNWTHSYSFDKDFPAPVLSHIAGLLRTSTKWRVFASSLPEKRWREVADEWWDENMRFKERLPIRIAGSGQGHSIYVYERIGLRPKRERWFRPMVSAHRDDSALEDSRFQRRIDPAFFGTEVRPNTWLAEAVSRTLVRNGATNVFKGALPGTESGLSAERARLLAVSGLYVNFGPRDEVIDYLEHRARPETGEEVASFRRRAQLAEERSDSALTEELFADPDEADVVTAVQDLFRRAEADTKRSLDAYYNRIESIEMPPPEAAKLEFQVTSVDRSAYEASVDERPRLDPSISSILERSLADAEASARASLPAHSADDALRVVAERMRIQQMMESGLLAETVPPGRVRDLARMPGFSRDLYLWMPMFYALFGLTRALDSSLLGKPPVSPERFELIAAFARIINYMRDSDVHVGEMRPAAGTEESISAELHVLDSLGKEDYKAEDMFNTEVLSVACPGVRSFSFSREEEMRGFEGLLRKAVSDSPGTAPLFLLFNLGDTERFDPTRVWKMSSADAQFEFGYSVRSVVFRDASRRRTLVVARDERSEWHLFDCSGKRPDTGPPFPVALGPGDPLAGGEARSIRDPVDDARTWDFKAPVVGSPFIVLLERDSDALGGLSAEYPLPEREPPREEVKRNDEFEAAVAYDLVLRSKPPPSELLEEKYANTEPENAGLLVGPPAFDGTTDIAYDAEKTEPLALAIAMALFRLNDSLDTAVLMRYPVTEPADAEKDFAQLLTDRLGGLVVYPMRSSGWKRIVGSRVAVSSHYVFADPFKMLVDVKEIGLDLMKPIPLRLAGAFGPDIVRKTIKSSTETRVAVAMTIAAISSAWYAMVHFGAMDPIGASMQTMLWAYKLNPVGLGTWLLSALGGPYIPWEAALPAAVAAAASRRPVEALAHMFGASLLRRPKPAGAADATRFAFRLDGHGTIDIPALKDFYSAESGSKPADQAHALMEVLRRLVENPQDNLGRHTLSQVHAPQFRNAWAVVDGETDGDDEELASVYAEPRSVDHWLGLAEVDASLPYFTISAFFGTAMLATSARLGRLSERIGGKSGTYDLSSLVWQAPGKAHYLVIARNKAGVYWCFVIGNRNPTGHPYNDRGTRTLGTVRLADLAAALASDLPTLPIYPRGWIISRWASKMPFDNLSKRCVFVSYNNRLLYPGAGG